MKNIMKYEHMTTLFYNFYLKNILPVSFIKEWDLVLFCINYHK